MLESGTINILAFEFSMNVNMRTIWYLLYVLISMTNPSSAVILARVCIIYLVRNACKRFFFAQETKALYSNFPNTYAYVCTCFPQGPGREKPLDDDQDRKNPQFIPKKGYFYEHDDRMNAEEG